MPKYRNKVRWNAFNMIMLYKIVINAWKKCNSCFHVLAEWEAGGLNIFPYLCSRFLSACSLCVFSHWQETWCTGSGCEWIVSPKRHLSSGCWGSPFAWAPCRATAGGRSGAARSSRGCWSPSVACERQRRAETDVEDTEEAVSEQDLCE